MRTLIVSCLALALVIAGCDSPSKKSDVPEAAAPLAPSSMDAGAPAASASSTEPRAIACSFIGTWTGVYSCNGLKAQSYVWVFRKDGTATGTINNTTAIQQKWSLNGTEITIADTGSACAAAGKYKVTWETGCNSFKMNRQTDGCPQRGDCVDGLSVTRK